MVKKMMLMRWLLAFAALIVLWGIVSAVIWPAGCPIWKRQAMRSAFVVRQYWQLVDKYVVEHDGRLPAGISDLFTVDHTMEYRRQQLVRSGANQNWKPDGWYTNNCLITACSDYMVIPWSTTMILILERPELFRKTKIAYAIYDLNSPCDKVGYCVVDPDESGESFVSQIARTSSKAK